MLWVSFCTLTLLVVRLGKAIEKNLCCLFPNILFLNKILHGQAICPCRWQFNVGIPCSHLVNGTDRLMDRSQHCSMPPTKGQAWGISKPWGNWLPQVSHRQATTLGKVVNTHVPLFTKQYNLVPCEGFMFNVPSCGSHSWVQ